MVEGAVRPELPFLPTPRPETEGELLQRRLALIGGLRLLIAGCFYAMAVALVTTGYETAWPATAHALQAVNPSVNPGHLAPLPSAGGVRCRRDSLLSTAGVDRRSEAVTASMPVDLDRV